MGDASEAVIDGVAELLPFALGIGDGGKASSAVIGVVDGAAIGKDSLGEAALDAAKPTFSTSLEDGPS
jgi:hypothetical protein